MPKLSIGPNGIRKTISKISPVEAIFEYIWNGFDAGATWVEINYDGELGGLAYLSIKDNGSGINFEELGQKFGVFLDSDKSKSVGKHIRQNSEVRGKRGYGRLTFDVFCTDVIWETIFNRNGENRTYKITTNKMSIDEYHPDPTKGDVTQKTSNSTGTTVTFGNIYGISKMELDEVLETELAKEYCWFLELNKEKGYSIRVNGEDINYDFMISERERKVWIYPDTNTRFDVNYVSWSEKPNDEYSRYYYLDQKNTEVFTETTKLNKKGDAFYNSIYITSPLFMDFDFLSPEDNYNDLALNKNRRSPEFKFLQENLNDYLTQKRKPFLERRSEQIIKELELADAFPKYDKNDPISLFQHGELVTIVREIYQVDPQIFNQLNKDQKKVFVRFLDLILQSGERDKLFEILDEIVGLSSESREELAGLLTTTRLKNIIRTIRLLEDRYKAVEDLKQLVFKEEWDVREVKHIQAFIDKNYWIFGEQYRLLTSAEPNFQEALARFEHYLYDKEDVTPIDHPDKNKEMDIFAVRKDVWDDRIQGIIIELKRPKVNIGREQLGQIETYMEVITSQSAFNDSNMFWEFHLVGRKYNDYIKNRLESERGKGEAHLVMSAKNFKIYVKTWSEVIGAFERRHNFLMDMLDMERKNLRIDRLDADAVIAAQGENTAVTLGEYERKAN